MSHAFGHDTTSEEVVDAFTDRVKGHVFLITGPTPGGLGDATIRALARGRPAALLLLGRNPPKYAPVVDAVHAIDPSITVRVYGVDLASFQSVRDGATKILAENERIDVLVNSGGVMGVPLRRSRDGVEEHFATNVVGHFLLTNLLMPALKRSDEPRVVNLSSGGHVHATGDYADYNYERREYTWYSAYAQSKLALLHFAQSLSRRGLPALAVNPGIIWGTNLAEPSFAETPDAQYLRDTAATYNVKEKTLTQGASTALVAALDPTAPERAGGSCYMDDCQPAEPLGEGAKRAGAAEELWVLGERLVGEKFAV